MRNVAAVVVACGLPLSLPAGPAQASEERYEREGGHGASEHYESKYYGAVEKMPKDRIGTWVVKGREIVVTKDTRIKEEHGRAEPGAYVEVEGTVVGKSFTAHKIEVKRSKGR
ncbi:MAG: hypothetical protein ED859_05840 [Desulfuromonadales bacterium]|nr:MAG: hypothetical protein ED859_05840 [Desulfuromonadales bacterium]